MRKFFLFSFHSVFIIAVLAAGLFLINKNVPASGYLKISAQLGKDTPTISSLGPETRVRMNGDYQEILESPVYFDLRSLRWFHGAWIELVYQPGERRLNGIGGKVGEPWNYDVKKPISDNALGDGWRQAYFYINFDGLLDYKNVRRFVIDTAGKSGQALKIRSLNIVLEK